MVAFAPPPVRPPSEYDNDDSATRAIAYPGAGTLSLVSPARGLWVGVQCDLTVTLSADTDPVTFYGAVGLMPISVTSISAGNATVLALY